jgi:hypothetical protein
MMPLNMSHRCGFPGSNVPEVIQVLMYPQIVKPLGILARIHLEQMLVQCAFAACPKDAF